VWFPHALWFWHARIWLQHTRRDYNTHTSDFYTQGHLVTYECDFDTNKCDNHKHECDFYTQSTISTRRVWFHTQSVVSIHTRVILKRMRVNMTLTSVITIRSSVISTRRVYFPHALWCWHARMWLRHTRLWIQHTQEWFLHAECDFDTY
jgi:hypothetical protein